MAKHCPSSVAYNAHMSHVTLFLPSLCHSKMQGVCELKHTSKY